MIIVHFTSLEKVQEKAISIMRMIEVACYIYILERHKCERTLIGKKVLTLFLKAFSTPPRIVNENPAD